MNPGLIAILVFAAGAVVVAIMYGRSAGKLLAPDPDEVIVIDEEPVRVENSSRARHIVYGKCRVRVSAARILISQKPLFGREYSVPRYVITLHDRGEAISLSSSLTQGAMQFSVPKSAISIEQDGKMTVISLPVPESALTKNQRVTFRTAYGGEFETLRG